MNDIFFWTTSGHGLVTLSKTFIFTVFYYKFCLNLLDGGTHKDRASSKQSLFRWTCPLGSTLRSCNSCSMAEIIVECLTYAHSCTRLVPSLTLPGYGLPPIVTIPARRLKHQAPVTPQTPDLFSQDMCSHQMKSNTLPNELWDRQNVFAMCLWSV